MKNTVLHFRSVRAVYAVTMCGIVALGVGVPQVASAGSALILKAGNFAVSEERQTIVGVSTVFDDSASGVFGGEFEWRQQDGLALGAELVRYETDVTRSGTSLKGTMETVALLFNVKKYFDASTLVHPYVGVGIGAASNSFSGNVVTGSAGGLAYQTMAGIEFRGQKLGLYTEVKYLSANTEDSASQNADGSGTGVFIGLSVLF